MNLNLENAQDKFSSLWNRPGGKVKTILGIGVGLFLLWKIEPWLMKMVNDTTELAWGLSVGTFAIAGAAVALFSVYYLFTNPKVKYGIMGFWDIIINKTLGLLWDWDPKSLLRAKVAENFKDVAKMENDVDEVASKEESIKADLDKNKAQIQQLQSACDAYKSLTPTQLKVRGLSPEDVASQISLNQLEIGKLQEWNDQLQPIYDNVVVARQGLNQLSRYAKNQAEWYKKSVELEIKKFESLSAANSAAKKFMAILSGNGDKSFMADQALLHMQDKMFKDAAEFKQVIRRSKDFTKSINLKEATYDKDALDYLNNYKIKYEANVNVTGFVPVADKVLASSDKFNKLLD